MQLYSEKGKRENVNGGVIATNAFEIIQGVATGLFFKNLYFMIGITYLKQ